MNKNFSEQYYQAFKIASQKNKMTASDYGRSRGINNVNNVYVELKQSAPNSLLRSLQPFKSVGAKVEIVITAVDGNKITLKP